MAQTYYKILGVAQNATPEEIEAAFKKRAREVHPDTVAPGNAYLRQVAAEAFKDLSQAKATLLNPFEREKYDAKLMYERASSSSAPPPRQASSASQAGSSPNSHNQRAQKPRTANQRAQSQRAQAPPRGATQRAPLRMTLKPLASSLESFSFVILGVISIFFVGWLMASGRTPPWWVAVLTLALGVASFRHGLKPATATKVRGPITPILIGGYVAAVIFFAVWLPSTEIVVKRSAQESGEPTAQAPPGAKTAGRFSPQHAPPPASTIVTADESGQDNAQGDAPRIWMDVRTGKNYRTRTIGDALMLEVVDIAGKTAAGILHCDFHRSGQEWTGKCSERTATDPGVHYEEATVSIISGTRLEGHTSDIPEFLMVPVDNVAIGGGSAPSGNSVSAEPDLSDLTEADKRSIETTCASDKLLQGPIEYNHCVSKQVDTLRNAPKPPDLSHLSARERDSLELVCSNSKLMEGPTAYNQCLIRQLDLMKKQPR
jgi:DnaJ domain